MKNKIELLMRLLSSQEYKDVLHQKDFVVDEPMNPQNYLSQLHRKLQQLKQIQDEEQNKLSQSLQNQDQLKQTLAECIRQSHVQSSITKQEINDKQQIQMKGFSNKENTKLQIQIKQQESDALDDQIQNLDNEMNTHNQTNHSNKQDINDLGTELNLLQEEAQQTKEENTNIILVLEQTNVTSNHLNQTLNQYKLNYQGLLQKNKLCQQKKIDVLNLNQFDKFEGQSILFESESKRLESDMLKLKPKLEQKVEKLQELDQLKQRIADQLNNKNEELVENRKFLQKLEEEYHNHSTFDKSIQQEKKAEQALEVERKLLMNEFQRVTNLTGIEQIQRDSQVHRQNDISREETFQSQQQLVQSQQEQITYLESELHYVSEEHQKLVIRRDSVLKEYAQLENSMDVLGLKFSRLNETINQQIQT